MDAADVVLAIRVLVHPSPVLRAQGDWGLSSSAWQSGGETCGEDKCESAPHSPLLRKLVLPHGGENLCLYCRCCRCSLRVTVADPVRLHVPRTNAKSKQGSSRPKRVTMYIKKAIRPAICTPPRVSFIDLTTN
jgi:hypothetical protein